MGKKLKSYLCVLWALMISLCINNYAFAAFEKFNDLPGVVICEVKSYGENSLKQEFFDTFEELLAEKLQESNKFRVEERVIQNSVEKALLTEMHMDSITNSKNFVREESNMQLVKYYDSMQRKEKSKKDVHLFDGYLKTKMREIAAMHNAKYLVFCNLKMIDVILKNPMASLEEKDLKGMKLKMLMDYYLVNVDNGKVFAGRSYTDKTTQVINLLFVKHGKRFTVQQLLHAILETQAMRVADSLAHEGLDKVSGDD